MGSVSSPPSIYRRALVAAVALITIPSTAVGVWFKVFKETPTVATRQEPVLEARSASGSGLVCDGYVNCTISGSLTINDGAGNQLNVGSGVVVRHAAIELTASGAITSTGTEVYSWTAPYAGRITDAAAFLGETASNNKTTVDIKIDGTSIFSTLLTIDATETGSHLAATPKVINTSANRFERYSRITFDTYAPATTPGKNLTSNVKLTQLTFP